MSIILFALSQKLRRVRGGAVTSVPSLELRQSQASFIPVHAPRGIFPPTPKSQVPTAFPFPIVHDNSAVMMVSTPLPRDQGRVLISLPDAGKEAGVAREARHPARRPGQGHALLHYRRRLRHRHVSMATHGHSQSLFDSVIYHVRLLLCRPRLRLLLSCPPAGPGHHGAAPPPIWLADWVCLSPLLSP